MITSVDGANVTVITPAGTVATITGYNVNDVFRNPDYPNAAANPIAQEDETPIVLSAVVAFRQSIMTSSMYAFANWSDGEFSFSNVSSQNAQSQLLEGAMNELSAYFSKRLAGAVRDDFPGWLA